MVTITVRSAELGTPYNAEVERLRRMQAIASLEGVRIGLLTEAGRMTQDPATAVVLCDNVKGLGLTLDPSHYICGPHRGESYDQVFSLRLPRPPPRHEQGPVASPRRAGADRVRQAHQPIARGAVRPRLFG